MTRRSHLTEIGCIACDELTELGAGKREGWLEDPSLLAALHPHSLALASAAHSLVLVLGWDPHRRSPSSPCHPVKIHPSLSPSEGKISSLEWLPFGDLLALGLGTSGGLLLVYSVGGDLIHKQLVHPGRVLRLRFREIARKGGLAEDSISQELCVVLPGVVARFDGSDIQSLLQRWFQESERRMWENKLQNLEAEDDETSYERILFQLWNVGKFGACVDAAITGIMPPPLLELQSSQRFYGAVTIGDDSVISAYRLSEDRSRSLVGTILSKVVPVTFSTIASFSKMLWRSEPNATRKSRPTPQPFAKASPLTCLKDPRRKGEKLTLSPSGTLAAITDSLGRILLLDTQALVVVRLWKGYRDACCLFVEMLVNRDKASSSSYYESTKNDYCLCLAIHAPRKGIIEIWKMRTGPRLLTIQCPKGSKILQPSTRFMSSSESPYIPLEVFLLNGDSGQLSVLNRSII
ncbi:hypothetical protein Cni_G00190 [Canna indica]|uniref:Rab3-GAP regulatory subunit N-terminal domain-containing protein n=1 Tax=Canna indica TaxID=4628 RepID=A0AAQ3JMD0_9LILI|nr:hypothetical protein Cni_G00190 [Canna indica]